MSELETFTMQSPSPDVLKWLTSGDVFSPEKVTEFARGKGYLSDMYGYDRLNDLIRSDLFKKRFENYWKYETDNKWAERPAKKAVHEAIVHTISSLGQDAQSELMGTRSGLFPGLDRGQIDTMNKQSIFLVEYYNEFWRGVS